MKNQTFCTPHLRRKIFTWLPRQRTLNGGKKKYTTNEQKKLQHIDITYCRVPQKSYSQQVKAKHRERIEKRMNENFNMETSQDPPCNRLIE